jgi:RHS repeat-associated protein
MEARYEPAPGTPVNGYGFPIGTDAQISDGYYHAPLAKTNTLLKRYYYHTNAIYSVMALSNSTGELAEVYHYDAYGRTAVGTAKGPDNQFFTPDDPIALNSAAGNPYTFTGQRLDPSGLMYYKNRYYHTELGRFTSRDPIGYKDGNNQYQYVASSPIGRFDPSGLECCCCCAEKISIDKLKADKSRNDLGKLEDGIGNELEFKIEISKKKIDKESNNECGIEWFENSNSVPDWYTKDYGVKNDTWADIFKVFKEKDAMSDTMREWHLGYDKIPCPAMPSRQINVIDRPFVRPGRSRKMFLVVRVYSSNNPECKCTNAYVEISLSQAIANNIGTIDYSPTIPPNLPHPKL